VSFLSLNLAGTPSLLIENGITVFVNWVEINQIGLTQVARETGFFRKYLGHKEIFSEKNPVSLVVVN